MNEKPGHSYWYKVNDTCYRLSLDRDERTGAAPYIRATPKKCLGMCCNGQSEHLAALLIAKQGQPFSFIEKKKGLMSCCTSIDITGRLIRANSASN